MTFSLVDDGTLDTVLVCDGCGTELRFNPDPHLDDCPEGEGESCECQDAVIEWAMADAEATHECLDTSG